MSKVAQDDLKHIRAMMERSNKMLSLSGLSGVFAGIFALVGAGLAYLRIQYFLSENYTYNGENSLISELIFIAIGVIVLSIVFGYILTQRKAKKSNQAIFTKRNFKIVIEFSIPLLAGGMACLAMIHYNIYAFIAPFTLIFYGLALLKVGERTFEEIKILGYSEIILGLISFFFIGYGLYIWAIGFGFLHIIYGSIMYFKYERKQ